MEEGTLDLSVSSEHDCRQRLPEERQTMHDKLRQVVVFEDARPMLARLALNRLTDAGIRAFLDNETTWQVMGDLPGSMIAPPCVVVSEGDADRARQIIADFMAEETSNAE